MKPKDLVESIPKLSKIKRKKTKGKFSGIAAKQINAFLDAMPHTDMPLRLDLADYLASQVKRFFPRYHSSNEATQPWRIRPSGQKCTRQEAMKKHGFGGIIGTNKNPVFFYGNFIEAWGKCIATLAGIEVEGSRNIILPIPPNYTCPVCYGTDADDPKHTGVPIESTPGQCVCSELDGIIIKNGKRYVVDWKSTKDIKWIKEPYDDKWGYAKQVKIYMMSLLAQGEQVDGGLLLFVDKNNGQHAEILIPLPTTLDMLVWKEHCDAIISSDSMENLPPIPEWGGTRFSQLRKPEPKTVLVMKDMRCNYCDGKDHCYGSGWTEKKKDNNDWIKAV